MDNNSLRDAIWTTRVSRVNAEKRLLRKNSFVKGINIYYSCVCILFSILTLIYDNKNLSIITIFMSNSLLITILFLNSLRYSERARDYRSNYTKLHRLELELGEKDITSDRIKQIKSEYCDLLDSSCNHISFDYYCTICNSNQDFKKKKWDQIKKKYYFCWIWRILISFFVICFPIAMFILSIVL